MKLQWLLAYALAATVLIPAAASSREIAVVMSRSLAPYKKACHGLSDASPDNLTRYNLEGSLAQARLIMDQVAGSGADAVVTIGTEATLAALEKLPGIPVVYSLVLEPQSFANQPSAGVLLTIPLETKLGLLKTILPQVKTVGVVYDAGYNAQTVGRLRELMASRGLRLLAASVTNAAELPGVLDKFTSSQVDALFSLNDPTTGNPEAVQVQIKHSQKNKLPYWAENEQAVKDGALLALTADYEAAGVQTADLVRRVLESRKTITAQPPSKLIMYLNEAVRKNLGVAEPALPANVTVVRY